MNAPFSLDDLKQFTGTEHWYRHSLIRNVLYTDGIRYLADEVGAYWLIDEIATNQLVPKVRSLSFQCWKLIVSEQSTASLTCEDGNGLPVFEKQIAFTDFPLREISIWFTENVILLPSEY